MVVVRNIIHDTIPVHSVQSTNQIATFIRLRRRTIHIANHIISVNVKLKLPRTRRCIMDIAHKTTATRLLRTAIFVRYPLDQHPIFIK